MQTNEPMEKKETAAELLGELAEQQLEEVSGGIQAGDIRQHGPGEFNDSPKPKEDLKIGIIHRPSTLL